MPSAIKNKYLWAIWIVGTLVAGGALASMMYISGNRSALLIGNTTSAHHQIELACDACHTSGFFATQKKMNKNMNKACLSCHKDELAVSIEHKPEITEALAVTVPMDYCSACHQEIEEERPSHVGLGFETCASAGCHNYHDNTALYEKFLVKHADQPHMLDHAKNAFAAVARSPYPIETALDSTAPETTLADLFMRYDEDTDQATATQEATTALGKVLTASDAVAPEQYLTPQAVDEWQRSMHAKSGVNCTSCHLDSKTEENISVDTMTAGWIESPGIDTCKTCHRDQTKTFVEGKHGMRQHPKLPEGRRVKDNDTLPNLLARVANNLYPDEPLQPMRVSEALIPMKDDAHDKQTGNCQACHAAHEPDLAVAAVDSCLTCHDDEHSNNYLQSSHYRLWQDELAGIGDPGTGVSCADCHMPKLKSRKGRGFFTTHNQNSYLRPNEKMIRPVCQSCHSLEFSIDALADPELANNNFAHPPVTHIESIDWAMGARKK